MGVDLVKPAELICINLFGPTIQLGAKPPPRLRPAVMATDIANAMAMSLTFSQIDTLQLQPASLPQCTVGKPETWR